MPSSKNCDTRLYNGKSEDFLKFMNRTNLAYVIYE